MSAPVTHYLSLTTIRRARLLSIPGRVLVREGQSVNAETPIAEIYQPDQHVFVDVPRALGTSTVQKAMSLLQCKVGTKVQKGDIIAETGGLFSRVVRSPINGLVVSTSRAQVLIEVLSQPVILRAGFPGTVTEVIADRGAILETTGTLIQAVWGNDHADMGTLLVLARSPEDELTRDRLEVSMRGAVIMAGYVDKADVLKAAAELPLRGLILASMNPDIVPVAKEVKCPIVLIEGFGRIPMNQAAYKLLSTSEKRDVTVSATPWNPLKGERPEVIIPLPAQAERAQEIAEHQSGQIVRITGSPYTGQVATIVKVRPGNALLANGLRAPAADVRMENGEQMTIPLVNLDVLE